MQIIGKFDSYHNHRYYAMIPLEKNMHQTYQIMEQELAKLQNERSEICVSIIVPTHRLAPDRRVDMLDVRRAISKAKGYLAQQYGDGKTAWLQKALDGLFEEINFSHNREGVALFVSRQFHELVSLYFPVTEKLIISDRFETRDLQYQHYYGRPYRVLLFSEKKARLFEGEYAQIKEVEDLHFPAEFLDDYEYSHPGRGLSYEGYAVTTDFEREKSQLEQIRKEGFAKKVDQLLKPYLSNLSPLVVTGTRRELATFKSVTTYPAIAGEIPGNYFYVPAAELGILAWQAVKGFYEERKQSYLGRLEESMGTGRACSGIAAVWTAAQEGKGAVLLVEKDFFYPGFLKKGDPYHLHLVAPQADHIMLPDAVNYVMDTVSEKGGEVVMLENHALDSFQHIALTTRY